MLSTSGSPTLLVRIDNDEEEMYEWATNLPRIEVVSGPRVGLVKSVNELVSLHPEPHTIYGLVPDDAVFVTTWWENYTKRIFNNLPNHLGVLSPSHNGGEFVNFPFISRELVNLLGWFLHPSMHHFCGDTILEIIGDSTAIKRATPGEFYIHHAHTPTDMQHYHADLEKFLGWAVRERRADIERVRREMW
jgi:hypothetical protein